MLCSIFQVIKGSISSKLFFMVHPITSEGYGAFHYVVYENLKS